MSGRGPLPPGWFSAAGSKDPRPLRTKLSTTRCKHLTHPSPTLSRYCSLAGGGSFFLLPSGGTSRAENLTCACDCSRFRVDYLIVHIPRHRSRGIDPSKKPTRRTFRHAFPLRQDKPTPGPRLDHLTHSTPPPHPEPHSRCSGWHSTSSRCERYVYLERRGGIRTKHLVVAEEFVGKRRSKVNASVQSGCFGEFQHPRGLSQERDVDALRYLQEKAAIPPTSEEVGIDTRTRREQAQYRRSP